MTTVAVNSYTHSVTYLADNMLKSVKDVIRLVGLDPTNFVDDWSLNMRAIKTWLGTGHLRTAVLEVYDPAAGTLVGRWDLDVVYGWSASGDGSFWADTDNMAYHIGKAGLAPADAKYRLLLETSNGRPDVEGWGKGSYLSTAGMVRQSLGSTVEHNGLGATAAYWRKG